MRYSESQLEGLRHLEEKLCVGDAPPNPVVNLYRLQDSREFSLLKRNASSYHYRGKYTTSSKGVCLSNYYELGERISTLYRTLKPLQSQEEFYVYRSVKPGPYYKVEDWEVFTRLSQVLPVSTSLYLDCPLDFLEDSEYALMRLRVCEKSFLCTSRKIGEIGKEEAREFLESSGEGDYTQSEITLLPGEIEIKGKSKETNPLTGRNLVVFEGGYRSYTYEEWEEEFQGYGGDPN